jgi:O-antigen ligase
MTPVMVVPAVALGVLSVTPIVAAMILAVPTHWLIGLGFIIQIRQDTWSAGGVLFDSIDVSLAFLALAMAVRGLPHRASLKRPIPRLIPWALLMGFLSAAYATSPDGSPYMTDPVRIAYQLYRYGIRFGIFYPAACLLLDTPRKFDHVLTAIVLAADASALMSLGQGYSGQFATGPFATKNILGSVLAVPLVIVFADILSGRRSLVRLLSAPLLIRSALFASSRGAFAGVLVGTVVAWALMYRGRIRTRLGAIMAIAVLATAVGLLAKPDLLQRPTIARLWTTVDLDQDTLVWRTTERWPHFLARTWKHPWLGWGTNVDETLGKSANTPHNGYLSLAVTFGFPALALYLLFSGLALLDAWKASSPRRDHDERICASILAGGIACILTHNMVDSVIMLPFAGGELWVFAAFAARLATRASVPAAERASFASARPALALGAGS